MDTDVSSRYMIHLRSGDAASAARLRQEVKKREGLHLSFDTSSVPGARSMLLPMRRQHALDRGSPATHSSVETMLVKEA